jgi:hypothetical protein
MTAGGVFAGAKKAVQTGTSMSGTPASAMVGRSGQRGWRFPDVTARPRTVPDLSGPVTGAGSTIVIITWLEATACTDSPLPLYGIISIFVPVRCLNISVVIWKMPALEA